MSVSAAPPTRSIARAAGSMSLAVLISRLLGLVREQVFAGFFGAGRAIDAFVVAFRIPNLLRDLFAEGALSTAFVTVFSQYDAKEGPERTWRLANNVLACLMLVVGSLTLAGIWFSPALVQLMAPDFGRVPGKLELTALMTRIMFPFLLLVSLAALVMGILNAKGRFFVPALASSFFNLGSIIAGVGLSFLTPRVGQPPIVGMAVGTLIGGLLQLLVQVPLLGRVGFRLQVVCDPWDPGLRRIFRLMLPAVLGLSAAQINIFINTFYAARCPEGSISWLNYAYRLDHLPQGLFGVALSVATLPLASRLAAREDLAGLKEACLSSLSLAMLLTVPAAAGLAVLAEPICALIYQYGRFTAYDTQQTAAALVFYTLGLLAFSGSKILVPVFYALNNTAIPVAGSFLTVAANLVFIHLTLEALQHRAIALSMSLASNVSFLFLLTLLHRRLDGLPLKELLITLAKVGLATLLMALAAYTAHRTLAGLLPPGVVGRLLAVAAAIAAGVGVYGTLILRLHIPEAKEALRLLLRRPEGG
ncbi:MAG: murein biosynthesis integral membrane protein MurJ [Syntrophobacterales bacterium]|nr:murein biosynthesis integral membrane protein MurJ [Syntrophobacterales bacterium]